MSLDQRKQEATAAIKGNYNVSKKHFIQSFTLPGGLMDTLINAAY